MKNTYANEPWRSAALARALHRPGIEILRYGLVIVLLWVGGMKFTSYEAAGIAPLEMHSPLINWLYVLMGQRNISDLLGVVEIALGRRQPALPWRHQRCRRPGARIHPSSSSRKSSRRSMTVTGPSGNRHR